MVRAMFGKFPRKKHPEPNADPVRERDAAIGADIRKARNSDPLVGARLGSEEILRRIMAELGEAEGRGRDGSLLAALGALGGYSCQAALRELATAAGLAETAALVKVSASDGKNYFFGDPLNEVLVGSPSSFWGLAAGAARQCGGAAETDLGAIFENTAKSLGTDSFGVPSLDPEKHPAGLPANYLRTLWEPLLPVAKLYCQSPAEWPILYGMATAKAIHLVRRTVDPDDALRLVMESAVPMSKVDLGSN